MGTLLNDARIALRTLAKSRSFAIVTVLTLAVAIGANTAIYSVVEGVLLKPLPYPDADELVMIYTDASGAGVPELPFSPRGFWHFKDNHPDFEEFGGFVQQNFALTGENGPPVQTPVSLTSNGAFAALGVPPLRGRFPTEAEDLPEGPLVALISHDLWQGRFGGDPGIIGQTITLNGQTREVIGVMPPEFVFPDPSIDIWVPLQLDPASQNFGGHGIQGFARLRDGADVASATREAEGLIQRFEEAGYGPQWLANVFTGRAIVRTVQEELVGDARRPLLIILGTVGFVLLIACSNVANLLLVRAESRTRDTAVRIALGAGRSRLIQGVMLEAVLLAAMGGVLGLLLAWVGTRILVASGPAAIPRLADIGVSPGVLGFTMAVSLGAGLLFGLVPALRVGSKKMVAVLRDGGRGSTIGRDRHRARNALVVTQVAMALLLLVGSGLMVRSFQKLRSVDPGFEPESMDHLRALATAQPLRRLRGHIAVLRAAHRAPGGDSGCGGGGGHQHAAPHGRRCGPRDRHRGVPHRPGRLPADLRGPSGHARLLRGDEHPPGGRAHLREPGSPGRVDDHGDRQRAEAAVLAREFGRGKTARSGVAVERRGGGGGRARLRPGRGRGPDHLPAPPGQCGRGGAGHEHDRSDQRRSADDHVGDPERDLGNGLRTPDHRHPHDGRLVVADSISRTTFTMSLLVVAAFVALFLGSVGIYGVISYVVGQRTNEMGIRMALGAQAGEVRGLVLRYGMVLSGIGVALGLVAAALAGGLMSNLLFGVDPIDPLTFVGGSGVFLLVALAASFVPAMRASRIAPARALREE